MGKFNRKQVESRQPRLEKLNPRQMMAGDVASHETGGIADLQEVRLAADQLSIGAQDYATGSGYLMYSKENLFERFLHNKPWNRSSAHLLAVRNNGSSWQYDNNAKWIDFDPSTTDRLIAEVDFSENLINSLQGVSGFEQGIAKGYTDGDLVFYAERFNGRRNVGEFEVAGSYFTFDTPAVDSNQHQVDLAGLNLNVGTQDYGTGTGHLMYSQQDVHERFSDRAPWNRSSSHLIAVRQSGEQWQYDTNQRWENFTPHDSDRLIAAIDFGNATVKSYRGDLGSVAGIAKGFDQGDLSFHPNQMSGRPNIGEYEVQGTYFVYTPSAAVNEHRIDLADVRLDVGAQDYATGQGYLMLSGSNLFDRFASQAPWNRSSERLIAVRQRDGKWQYDNNFKWIDFRPSETDTLVAAIDFDLREIRDLKGTSETIAGVRSGYSDGDLAFQMDYFGGRKNKGEIGVAGTYVVLATQEPGDVDPAVPANQPPFVAGTMQNVSVSVGLPFVVQIPQGLFADADAGDSVALQVLGLPQGASFDPIDRVVRGVVGSDAVGAHSLLIRATDNSGSFAELRFELTVANKVNESPQIYGDLLDAIVNVSLPEEPDVDAEALLTGDESAATNLRTRTTLHGGVTQNVYQGTNWTGVVSAGAQALGFLPSQLFRAGAAIPGANPFPNPALSHNFRTSNKNDVLYGGDRQDDLKINHRGGIAIAGKSADRIEINAPYATGFANKGNDHFVVSSHHSNLIGGAGRDLYELRRGAENTTAIDTSSAGTIKIPDVKMSDIKITEHGKTLKVSTPDGRSLSIPQFGILPRDGWVIQAADKSYRIQNILRPSQIEAVAIANNMYPENELTSESLEKLGFEQVGERIDDAASGLEAEVYKRKSFQPSAGDVVADGGELPDGHYTVGVRGTELADARDIRADLLLGGPQSAALFNELEPLVVSGQATNLTISGHSLGGIVAVETGLRAAMANPNLQVTVYAYNAIGVEALSSAAYDLPNLRIEYINYEHDFLHQIGEGVTGATLGLSYPAGAIITEIPSRIGGQQGSLSNLQGFADDHFLDPILDFYTEQNPSPGELRTLTPRVSGGSDIPEQFVAAIKSYLDGLDRLRELPTVPASIQRFDIGMAGLSESGWINVFAETQYTATRGYGWKPGEDVEIRDRVANDDLMRDLAVGKSLEFWNDVQAGSYDVTIHHWDTVDRQQISLYANDEYVGEIHSLANQPGRTTFRVDHLGGTLKLRLRDHGGTTKNAALNAIEFSRVAAWSEVDTSSSTRVDPSLVVLVPGADEPISWWDRVVEVGKPIVDIASTVASLVTAPHITPLLIAKSAYSAGNSVLALHAAFTRENDPTPAWVFQAQVGMNLANAKAGLPLIDVAKNAVSLNKVENTENQDLADLFGEVIVIDAGRQLNDGAVALGAFGDGVSDEGAHRHSVNRLRKQLVRTINAVAQQEMAQAQANHVDIFAAGADFGAIALREAIDKLAEHALTPAIDHVQLDLINPIAVKNTDNYFLHTPTTRPFSFEVTHYLERVADAPSEFYKESPLDGSDGGSHRQRLNSIVRQFSPEYTNGERLFRNLSGKGKFTNGAVKAVSLSPDGKFLAQGTGTGFISIFGLEDSSRIFDGRLFSENGVQAIEFSPDGSNLAVLNTEGRLAIIDVATGKHSDHKFSGARLIQWADDGSQVFLARKNGQILATPVNNGKLGTAVKIRETSKELTGFWMRGDRFFTTHQNKKLNVWIGSSTIAEAAYSFNDEFAAQAVASDGQAIALAFGNQIHVYQYANKKLSQTLTLDDHDARVNALTFSGDDAVLVSGGNDRTIRRTDAKDAVRGQRKVLSVRNVPMLDVSDLVTDANGQNVFVSYENGKGGGVIDKDISGRVRDRLPFWTGIFGAGEQKVGDLMPVLWADEFAGESRFFRQKDNPVRESVFGGSRENWKLALTDAANERLPDDEAIIDESPRLTPIQLIPSINIFDTYTFPNVISDFFEYDGTEEVTYKASSNQKDVRVALDDETGEIALQLKPHSEGVAVVSLTASVSNYSVSVETLVVYNARNHNPIAPTIRREMRPGNEIEIKVRDYVTDIDADTIDLDSVGDASSGRARIRQNYANQIRYTPNDGFAGVDRFTYSVSDGHGGTASGIVEVSVVNVAPVAPTIRTTTRPGQDVEIKVRDHVTDADGDDVMLTNVGAGLRGRSRIRENYPNQIRYTPNDGFVGVDRFTYTVSDGKGGTSTGNIEVAVVNEAPKAPLIRVETRPGKDVEIEIRKQVTDPDGDTVSLTAVTAASRGHARIRQNYPNQVRYTPNVGFIGVDRFTYTVSDGKGGVSSGTIEVSVVNSAPVTPIIRVSTRPGKDVEIEIRKHSTDPDGDTVSLTAVGAASRGHARIRQNYPNQVRYTPSAGFIGVDRFTYKVSDGKGGVSTGTIEVSVVNSAPTAPTIRVTTRPGKDVEIEIRKHATDVDGDTVSLTKVGAASRGFARIRQNYANQVRYTPNAGFVGVDRFTYTISDGKGGVSAGTIEVSVINSAPTAPTIRLRVKKGKTLEFKIRDYVRDADNDTVNLLSVGSASNGNARQRSQYPNLVRYTPSSGFRGLDQFTYRVSDGKGGLSDGLVVVEVF